MSFSCFLSFAAMELILFCSGLLVFGCSKTQDCELAKKTIEGDFPYVEEPSLVLEEAVVTFLLQNNLGETGTTGWISLTCLVFEISLAFYYLLTN